MRVVVAVILLLGGAVPVSASAAPARVPAGPLLAVTLITGDRVLVRPEGVAAIRPAKGREGVQFIRRQEGGDTYVVPVDAATLVAAGTVDRRLFNVTKLVEHGYDDRSRVDLPVIVTYADRSRATAASARTRGLDSVNGDAVRVDKSTATGFWRNTTATGSRTLTAGVARLWLDGRVTATLDHSVPQVGAPAAWQAGHRGQGATVAVLDTGIDDTHPDLAGAVVAAQDFTGSASGTTDRYGHGTHVASIITGSGAAFHGKYQGVAPDAKLLNGKVLDDSGFGSDSGIIAGMEWAVAQGADVVNMSIGSEFSSDGTGPMDLAVNRLTAESGTLFVVSAGNTGPASGSINSPGAADAALTVGAVDRDGSLAGFSSRGPRTANLAVKPDITAPGVAIAAALATDSVLGREAPVVDGAYGRLNGTSMAAPHVAGAAAILAAQRPSWDADELKAALMGSAAPQAGQTVHEQGAGRLDLARAVTQPVFATPASVSNGMTRWPHDDDRPFRDTLTYHNAGTTAVTLAVAADVRDPAGAAAPPGMFTLSTSQVTVPAGGTASVTLVTDTSVTGTDGGYGGLVTATSGQAVVRVPVGVTREAESYDVAVDVRDRTGRPAPEYVVQFVNVARPEAFAGSDPSGRVTIRVPKGRYYVEALVSTAGGLAMLVEPELVIAGSTTIVVDARRARPTGFRVDRPAARAVQGEVGFRRVTDFGEVGFEASGPLDALLVAPSMTSVRPDRFSYRTTAHYARPDGTGGFAGSPYLYHLNREVPARVPADLVHRLRDRDLHAVSSEIAASAPDQIVAKDFLVQMTAPARFVELYSPGRAFLSSVFVMDDPEAFTIDVEIIDAPALFPRPGRSTKRWNVGVFGPALPDNPFFGTSVGRRGDTIDVLLATYSDQTPIHHGIVEGASETMILRRNGQVVGEVPGRGALFDVPAQPGTYQLTYAATQSSTTLSTSMCAQWTFASATVAGDELVPLPLMVVRFAPALDEHNRARAGRAFTFPVYVQRQVGAAHGTLRALRVQVSYDDGRTWRPASVHGFGLSRTVTVHHPKGGGFVSLRASALDSRGNAVEQTTIWAYALRG